MEFRGLSVEGNRETDACLITDFAIREGNEQAACGDLLECLADGCEVCMRNKEATNNSSSLLSKPLFSLPISPSYRQPMIQSLAIQATILLLATLMLDGGRAAHVCLVALLGFWMSAAIVIGRRPLTPSKSDLQWIQVGYVLVLIMTAYATTIIWPLRGVDR